MIKAYLPEDYQKDISLRDDYLVWLQDPITLHVIQTLSVKFRAYTYLPKNPTPTDAAVALGRSSEAQRVLDELQNLDAPTASFEQVDETFMSNPVDISRKSENERIP